jgi:hypothetical protein
VDEDDRDEDSDCGCGFKRDRRRKMRRGDTLQFNLQVFQNTFTLEYGTVWPGEAPPPNCVPVNLTGYRVWFTAKYEYPDWDNQSVAQLDNMALGGVTTPGTLGQVSVTMPSLATQGFADGPTRLVYDLQVELSGVVSTPEEGRLTVNPDVTRST